MQGNRRYWNIPDCWSKVCLQKANNSLFSIGLRLRQSMPPLDAQTSCQSAFGPSALISQRCLWLTLSLEERTTLLREAITFFRSSQAPRLSASLGSWEWTFLASLLEVTSWEMSSSPLTTRFFCYWHVSIFFLFRTFEQTGDKTARVGFATALQWDQLRNNVNSFELNKIISL